MNNFWKLTNVLFDWMMRKRGSIVLAVSLVFGALGIGIQAFPSAATERDLSHLAEAFLPYEAIVDGSGVAFVFLLGLVLLFLIIFLTANSFFTNGRGIYTLLMLPIRRRQLYFAFGAAALAMLFVYFAAWMLLMTLLYFPVMANYARVAAQEVFRLPDGVVVQGLEAARANGLYLAFRRSVFLSTCFPSSLWQALSLLSGGLLALASVLYGGLHVGERGGQVMVMLCGVVFGIYTAAVPLLYLNDVYNSFGNKLLYFLNIASAETGVGSALLFSAVALILLLHIVKLTLHDMENKKA